MNPEQVIEYFGGQTKLADLLDVSRQAVSNWKIRGKIPLPMQVEISYFSQGKFKVERKARKHK